jgi:hypothetical protein
MQLKRIEVIADDEAEIIEAARRMSKNYDFVVTSGGIGPTYDLPGPLPTRVAPHANRSDETDTTISPTSQ